MLHLLDKYNIPVPRYTSYPTVPLWDTTGFSEKAWVRSLQNGFAHYGKHDGIALYIHLPFCESMCTFCGCNKRITLNHAVELPYIQSVIKEWNIYLERLPHRPTLAELHLGGGTPTFFSAKNLALLITAILETVDLSPHVKMSFEGHPGNTTRDHLEVLHELGFRRVSFGIQDFDPVVQKAINRIQSLAQVEEVTSLARQIGFSSVNYDIIYGLPFQKIESVVHTVNLVGQLRPDRIAYYSYAHVPWMKGNGQRKFSEKDLPSAPLKHRQYMTGREMLGDLGYLDVGMDHWSTDEDELYRAFIEHRLHRNFMGYTDENTDLTIGLGISAISDSVYGMAQNTKDLKFYHNQLKDGFLPLEKGHLRSLDDRVIRKAILDLMCRLQVDLSHEIPGRETILDRLREPFADDLIKFERDKILVTDKGKLFLRNICMAFDLRLWENQPSSKIFSLAV